MSDDQGPEQRLVVLAPTGKDAALARTILSRAGVRCVLCDTLEQVCDELDRGAAAVLLAEESIVPQRNDCLADWLGNQPAWSDLPVLVLARPGADSAAVAQAMDVLGNVTVLERPTRVAALVSTVRTALRARQRQYQTRNQLVERIRELQSQAFLGAIVASSDDAIITRSLEGNIMTWNAGAERMYGYSAEEVVGQPITILIPPERQDEETALLDRLCREERVEHFETVRMRKDGRLIDISLTISPVRDADDKIIGSSKIARDITGRKQAEAALREADRRKDEFLATLAHELRNPLAPICNALHLLRTAAGGDASAQRLCEMMERQVNHMVRLVDDLMEASRITRGLIELRKEEADLASVIRSAMETSKPLITAAAHDVTITMPDEPVVLYGDAIRLGQIFANLLNNAAKYTDHGGRIWLSARRDDDDVLVSVRDNGIGIAPQMLPRVFEMFTQADHAASRSQGGLGIGLTLVRTLVELHGGTISARSEGVGKGSEFTVRLPIRMAGRESSATLPPARTRASLLQRRVLVVDDNKDAAASMGMVLQFLGTDVLIVHDGRSAVASLESYRPDVVLLDLGMPGMDGFEVAREIRRHPQLHGVLLIALTGWGQEVDRNRTRAAGFDHHLVKPADIVALQSLLVAGKGVRAL